MLYLSQLTVDGRCREARRDLGDCHALHQRILMGFPDETGTDGARARFGVLYRVEPMDGGARILVQSRERPDWSRLPAGYLRGQALGPKRVDENYARIAVGQELLFRLHANPTRRIADRLQANPTQQMIERNAIQGEHWRGKRVDVRGEAEQLAWLSRKGEQGGFVLLAVRSCQDVGDVRMAPGAATHGVRQGSGRMTFGSVTFEGRLRVTDAARFRAALATGIGSGKAYGFGLLSVAGLGT